MGEGRGIYSVAMFHFAADCLLSAAFCFSEQSPPVRAGLCWFCEKRRSNSSGAFSYEHEAQGREEYEIEQHDERNEQDFLHTNTEHGSTDDEVTNKPIASDNLKCHAGQSDAEILSRSVERAGQGPLANVPTT